MVNSAGLRDLLEAERAAMDRNPDSHEDPSPSGTGDGSSGIRDTAATTIVATHGASPLESLTVEKIKIFIARAEPECSRNPAKECWHQFILEEVSLKLQLYQLAARGSDSSASHFDELEAMDWPTFVHFLRCFMDDSGPSKEKTSEGQEIWDRLQGDEKVPLDPRNLHGYVMRTGEALSYAKAQGFTDEQEREVIIFVLRRMKEGNSKNLTLQRMTDELKADEEHQKGLKSFLTAVLKTVAKQTEYLNSFRRSNLKGFPSGPAKAEATEGIAKTQAHLFGVEPQKNKGASNKGKNTKRDRNGALKENRDQNKGTCNACGREGHKWEDCKVHIRGHIK